MNARALTALSFGAPLLAGTAAVVGGGIWWLRWRAAENLPERPFEETPRAEPTPVPTGATVQVLPAATPAVPTIAPVTLPSTGKRLVDQILGKLADAARSSGIPLGLLVGWITKESAGNLWHPRQWKNGVYGDTSLDERGYFQIHPDESKALWIDHKRLSADPDYSIAKGVDLIQKKYAKAARSLGITPEGSPYFWKLVKLGHTMGSGAEKKIVAGAKAAGAVGSWEALEAHALANNEKYLRETKHSPKKWFPLVDDVYRIGVPFGFGEAQQQVVVGSAPLDVLGVGRPVASRSYTPTDCDALARAVEASPARDLDEKQAVAWVHRNRARVLGAPIEAVVWDEGVAPSDEARKVARAVLTLPAAADPTGGAVDYACPEEEEFLERVAEVHRALVVAGDEEAAAAIEPLVAGAVDRAAGREGLVCVGAVGALELYA